MRRKGFEKRANKKSRPSVALALALFLSKCRFRKNFQKISLSLNAGTCSFLDCPVKDGDDLKGEAVLLARLCGMNMEDFRKLDVEDYQQVQKCYLRFHLGADDAEGGHAAVRDSVPTDGMGA